MSNPIKEYLVSIGLQLNPQKLNNAQNKIKETTGLLKKLQEASQFVQKGLNGLSLAFLGLAGASTKLLMSLAKQDQQFETLAQKMFVSRKSVNEYKLAVDALGVSIDEIQFNPTLMKQYKELVADGRKMFVGTEYKEAMGLVRSFIFEFTRLKQEANYLLQWVGYYLVKNLSTPLQNARKALQGFNDFVVANLPKIGNTIGRLVGNLKDFFGTVFRFFSNVWKEVQKFWDSIPPWCKKLIYGMGIIGAIFIGLQNPIIFVGAVIGGILLLIEDFQGHLEGKKSQFGAFWDSLIEWIKKTKQTIYEWKDKALKWIQEVIGKAKGWIDEIKQKVEDKLPEIQEKFNSFCTTVKEGFTAAVEALKSFITHMDRLTFFWSLVQRHGFAYAMGRIWSGDFESDFQKEQNEKNQKQRYVNFKREFDSLSPTEQDRIIQNYKSQNNGLGDRLEYYKNNGYQNAHFPYGLYSMQKEREEGNNSPKQEQVVQALGNIPSETKQEEKAPTGTVEKPKGYNPNVDQYDHIINYYAMKYGVKQSLLKALLYQESKMNSNAVGRNEDGTPSGALGLAQLMPETAEELGVKDRLNPQQSIMGAAKYLSQLQKRYKNDTTSVLRAYNWGMGNVDLLNQGLIPESAIPQQTRDYVKNINNALAKNFHPWKAEYAKYNERPLRPVDRITPIAQVDGSACGVVSVAMANNAINGNNDLTENGIYSAYGYDLLGALNGTNKNKNVEWKDLGNRKITDKELKEMYNSYKQGLPFIFAGNRRNENDNLFSPSGRGHIMLGKKIDWEKQIVYYADPATGTIESCTFKELKEAGLHPDGNFVFVANYKTQPKPKSKSQNTPDEINAPSVLAPISEKEKMEGEERKRQSDLFMQSKEEAKKGHWRYQNKKIVDGVKNVLDKMNPFKQFAFNDNMRDFQNASNPSYHSSLNSNVYVGGINMTINTNSNDPQAVGNAVAYNLQNKINYFALNRGLSLG